MITHLILDTKEATAGTPVRVIEFTPGHATPQGKTELVIVQLPDGKEIVCDAGAVSSGIHSPEETLSILASASNLQEGTLLKAAQQKRLVARQSGVTWLSTITAIQYAISQGKIKK